MGTFTSVDPVLGVGGSTGWNGYLYANANPANLTDPSGACIGPLTFLLPVCIEAGKLLVAGIATATVVGGAAFVNDVRGQVWYNQTQAGLSFIDSFQHLNVAGLIDSTLKGAEFGFNLGTGFGAGALAQKFGFAGAKAIAAGLASDVILGASWDVAAHGDNFFAAVAGNTLGFLGGELAGNLLQRGVKQVARSIGGIHLPAGRFAECSFDADTLITTENGEEPISELNLGERVLAYNEATEKTGYYPISAVLKHTDPIMLHLTVDGETVDTTPEHPFYTEERGWVAAGELQVGDHLRRADGGYGVVQSIHTEPRSETMYNLTVEEAHTFFVGKGQWLVHNECYRMGGKTAQNLTPRMADAIPQPEINPVTNKPYEVGLSFTEQLPDKGWRFEGGKQQLIDAGFEVVSDPTLQDPSHFVVRPGASQIPPSKTMGDILLEWAQSRDAANTVPHDLTKKLLEIAKPK